MQKDESSDLIRNILYQVTDLQGTQAWEQAHREIQGLREHNDNPIFTGALGLWNGVIIYSHDKVVTGTDAGPGSDVPYADALFFGYQAGIWAEAQVAPDWIEKSFDQPKVKVELKRCEFGEVPLC